MNGQHSLPYNAGYAYYCMSYTLSLFGLPVFFYYAISRHTGQFSCHPGDYAWIMLGRLIYWVLYVVTYDGDNERLVPPRFGAGEKGPGWG